jgi:hypothetical protein
MVTGGGGDEEEGGDPAADARLDLEASGLPRGDLEVLYSRPNILGLIMQKLPE